MMPGTPFNSMGMEAFNDTPVVNGTAYPTVTVDPKSRITSYNVCYTKLLRIEFDMIFKENP